MPLGHAGSLVLSVTVTEDLRIGELVREPGVLRGALDRALAAGGPALVNVLTDPAVAYPRSSNLA